jgi:hypothetical protein
LKKQTGVSVDGQVWDAYRDVCSREKLRLSKSIEEFLRLVLRKGSALTVLNMMETMAKERSEGFAAYARVLLNWYKNGRTWIHVTDESEAPVEPMLLHALKDVADPQLRRDIQEALIVRPRRQADEKDGRRKSTVKEKPAAKEEPPEPAASATLGKIEELKKQVAGRYIDADQAQKMLNKVHRIREKLKSDEKG